MNAGPAPGAYDAPTQPHQKGDRASFFGRSKAIRFDARIGDTPGPGSYVLPSSLRLQHSSDQKQRVTGIKSTIKDHPLTQAPIGVSGNQESSSAVIEIMSIRELQTQEHDVDGTPIQNVSLDPKVDNVVGPETKSLSLTAHQIQGAFAASTLQHHPKSAKIIWKRKHVPPSIPVGQSTFGYSENAGMFCCLNKN